MKNIVSKITYIFTEDKNDKRIRIFCACIAPLAIVTLAISIYSFQEQWPWWRTGNLLICAIVSAFILICRIIIFKESSEFVKNILLIMEVYLCAEIISSLCFSFPYLIFRSLPAGKECIDALREDVNLYDRFGNSTPLETLYAPLINMVTFVIYTLYLLILTRCNIFENRSILYVLFFLTYAISVLIGFLPYHWKLGIQGFIYGNQGIHQQKGYVDYFWPAIREATIAFAIIDNAFELFKQKTLVPDTDKEDLADKTAIEDKDDKKKIAEKVIDEAGAVQGDVTVVDKEELADKTVVEDKDDKKKIAEKVIDEAGAVQGDVTVVDKEGPTVEENVCNKMEDLGDETESNIKKRR